MTPVRPALDHEPTVASRYKPFEDGGKLLGNLLERALDGLVLTLVKMRDEFLNRLLRLVKFGTALEQMLLLAGKAVILFESLLVDMLVFL